MELQAPVLRVSTRRSPIIVPTFFAYLQVLHRNIQEALRMHPPLTILMRYCKKPFSVTTSKGLSFVIPKARSLLTARHILLP